MIPLIGVVQYLVFYIVLTARGTFAGYHYEKPKGALRLVSGAENLGHNFGLLPTIQPLPPVPALPPLPTPRAREQITQTQTLIQTHPMTNLRPGQTAYLPTAISGISKVAQQYKSPSSQARSAPPSAPSTDQVSNLPNQPLRIPYGKQAIISYPITAAGNEKTYRANGRELKQYAVVEIIDNDIEQNTQPFLSTPFFDNYRAHIGATGTGAVPVPLSGSGAGDAIQLNAKASTSVLGQQRSLAQGPVSDAVALGSGGLGIIRLADGQVYLGSGSLGYISSQQHTQSVNEARTRTGAPHPDPLHFGHGPLGGLNRFNRFLFKFK